MIRISIAIVALSVAPPAAAQMMGPPAPPKAPRTPVTVRSEYRLPSSARYDTVDVRDAVRAGRRAGTLSRREARGYRREAGVIDSLAERYAADGQVSDAESRELNLRSAVLRDQVNIDRMRGAPPK